MKAVAAVAPKRSDEPEFLVDIDAPDPRPGDHDLLVEVRACAFNPVDYKRRQNAEFLSDGPKILGWDAAGVVRATGAKVSSFRSGDEVFYSGEMLRPGCNAALQTVDARLVGRKPSRLSFAEAASLPLTSVTAWEALFDKLRVPMLDDDFSILVLGGAGGVGSIALQLLRRLTRAKVLATASRPESAAWCERMGAHAVIDRKRPLVEGIAAAGAPELRYVFVTSGSEQYASQLVDAIQPFGEICIIDDPKHLDVFPFKWKSVSIHWELMFTRSLFNAGRERQGGILNKVAALADDGQLTHTIGTVLRGLSAKTFMEAHRMQESGKTIGKIVAEF